MLDPKGGCRKVCGVSPGGSPLLAGDEGHWALVVLAELLCHCFWQRRLIKTRGAVGSGMCQGSVRALDMAGSQI